MSSETACDDSRLQALWQQQHRRQNWIVGGCCATALLIGAALVVMAFRLNTEPPKVEVAAPVINIPEQPASRGRIPKKIVDRYLRESYLRR